MKGLVRVEPTANVEAIIPTVVVRVDPSSVDNVIKGTVNVEPIVKLDNTYAVVVVMAEPIRVDT